MFICLDCTSDRIYIIMYNRLVLLLVLVATIITGGTGESFYMYSCQCITPAPQCCDTSNLGKLIAITKDHRPSLIWCPSTLPAACPTSCKDVLRLLPDAASGCYNIYLADGNITSVYCNMEGCDGEGGWTRVAYLNMSDPSQQCPTELRLYDESGVRACGRQVSSVGSCESITYSTNDISYSEVCGRMIGYQYATTDAVSPHGSQTIDSPYVDGVSITHGSPRQHIWTMMVGLWEVGNSGAAGWECPCNTDVTIAIPSFIGDDYFCESGNPVTDNRAFLLHTDDPLWDGEGCGGNEGPCCNAPGIPWFHKVFNSSTTDDIELRVCADESTYNEDTPISLYEIYVK